MAAPLDRIRVGSAPDSWGVRFPDDPAQVSGERFPDEVPEAGYSWIELGPYGCLPTDPARLTDETARRDLKVSAGTVFTGLHRGPSVRESTWAHVSQVAVLTQAVGARHLVVIPSFWRDDRTAELLEPPELTHEQWAHLTKGMMRVPPVRAKSRTGGGSATRSRRRTDSTSSSTRWTRRSSRTSCATRSRSARPVQRGVMCEPPSGVPELEPVLVAAQRLGVEPFAIVEQDMYPCEPDRPLPIAVRTREFLRSCGA